MGFRGLLIPGAFNPWNMIEAGTPLEFLKNADAAGKILSYMCHGPIPVSAADLVQGKKITGWLASKDAVTSMVALKNGENPDFYRCVKM